MGRTLKQYGIITLGLVIVAAGIHLFLVPSNIAAGGAMGVAIVVNHFIPEISVGQIMLVVNIFLFGIAIIAMGLDFGIKTVYASFGLSALLWLLDAVVPLRQPFTRDLLLATLLGVIISGFGMAVIFNEDASTGGTDIVAKIVNRWTHIAIGKCLLVADTLITLAATAVFGLEKGMYALLGVVVNGYIIDYVVEGLNVFMQVFIISKKAETIGKFIMQDLGRGVTFFSGRGGYSGREIKIIYSVIGRKEFVRLKGFIKEIDPEAFVTVQRSHDVLGEGFKTIG